MVLAEGRRSKGRARPASGGGGRAARGTERVAGRRAAAAKSRLLADPDSGSSRIPAEIGDDASGMG